MLARLLALVPVSLVCSGCFLFTSPDSAPPIEEPMATSGAAAEEWTVELGQGEGDFAPLDDGAHIGKVKGPQGGHHIPVSARLRGPNVREALTSKSSTYTSAYSYAYASIEIEVVVGGKLESRAISSASASGADDASADFLNLNAYVSDGARGETTILVKVANTDRSQWAAASRTVVLD